MKKLILILFLAIFAGSNMPAQIKVVLVQDFEQMKANGTKNKPAANKRANINKTSSFNTREMTDDESNGTVRDDDNEGTGTEAQNLTSGASVPVKEAAQKGNTGVSKTKNANVAADTDKKANAASGSDYVKRLRERQKAARGK
ncbi:MAG TPA: hypothetical protein PKH58_04190 [Paludibacteraceae bacterium]|nr:hypothetical protein [Paludibacteraceae bacterium]HPT44229.1 hypothetical protein [Paludibacteraceae bacterium]